MTAPQGEDLEFIEERSFFRSIGMTDPQIADRLGIDWETYRRRFLRHPDLGKIHDPREAEREWGAGWRSLLRRPRGA